ncbi:lipopolysaccharide N-acetylmannosaminouronosyltransferase [Otariodibacter oris]|uniref:UDP-N-acetyl-D-mannosaminouronate:lipid I N-acetyl-D-mannosaminouronosyltransferase n=1 Tax=Otariodibacter oris TaxID=1032623 RepID=A0A420XEW9_9PAST|nr:lipopolysaccharide N-acetylmannosaminouronosyltransferase [Otariodibacter oris]QGM80163.1 lipopolysaccharide N-acetylmannosaminouronosyltransferase [Otariodibacter oris]RKR70512.1 UDP-N-acetyl-D-mannosaminouronate:lipid I N-acetyl-D-mannosaminouronosyltransferase [Otariodibacter oris]
MNKVQIRGIDILVAPHQQTLIEYLLGDGDEIKRGILIAINAEKVIISESDPIIRDVLHNAEYNYADGISIVLSIKKKYPEYTDIQRIAGADLWVGLMKKASQLNMPVFLVGAQAVTLAETNDKLVEMGVNVVGTQDGYFDRESEEEIIQRIAQSGAKLVTVALGSPKQELFIQKAQSIYPDALYMGVGGTYDVFTGKVKRAPQFWQKLGLEWLYRLLSQPTRWRRQLRLAKYACYYWLNRL